MELYLQDTDMMVGRPLHWPLPGGTSGRLITIGPCTRGARDPESVCNPANELIDYACDNTTQFINIIRQFSNITLLYFNCHSIDAGGNTVRDVGAGVPAGIRIGGANIYESDLSSFYNLRNDAMHDQYRIFAPHVSYESLGEEEQRRIWDLDATENIIQQNGHTIIQGEVVYRWLRQSFIPSIIMRSCSIGRNHSFCQGLANRARVFVFAPMLDQWSSAPTYGPWHLHGPVFFYRSHSYSIRFDILLHSYSWAFNTPQFSSRSPFQQRLGQQRIATGPGRGVGRCRGIIG